MKMTTDHELKLWPNYFDDVATGKKEFELRNNDRGFKVGQLIKFKEFKPNKTYDWDKSGYYTGRETIKKVKYVLGDNCAGIQTGYAILGLSEPSASKNVEELLEDLKRVSHHTIDEELWRIEKFIRNLKPSASKGVTVEDINFKELQRIIDLIIEDKSLGYLKAFPATRTELLKYCIYQNKHKIFNQEPSASVGDGELLNLLEKAQEHLKLELEAIGGCDHNVGICCCGLRNDIEEIEQALKNSGRRVG